MIILRQKEFNSKEAKRVNNKYFEKLGMDEAIKGGVNPESLNLLRVGRSNAKANPDPVHVREETRKIVNNPANVDLYFEGSKQKAENYFRTMNKAGMKARHPVTDFRVLASKAKKVIKH